MPARQQSAAVAPLGQGSATFKTEHEYVCNGGRAALVVQTLPQKYLTVMGGSAERGRGAMTGFVRVDGEAKSVKIKITAIVTAKVPRVGTVIPLDKLPSSTSHTVQSQELFNSTTTVAIPHSSASSSAAHVMPFAIELPRSSTYGELPASFVLQSYKSTKATQKEQRGGQDKGEEWASIRWEARLIVERGILRKSDRTIAPFVFLPPPPASPAVAASIDRSNRTRRLLKGQPTVLDVRALLSSPSPASWTTHKLPGVALPPPANNPGLFARLFGAKAVGSCLEEVWSVKLPSEPLVARAGLSFVIECRRQWSYEVGKREVDLPAVDLLHATSMPGGSHRTTSMGGAFVSAPIRTVSPSRATVAAASRGADYIEEVHYLGHLSIPSASTASFSTAHLTLKHCVQIRFPSLDQPLEIETKLVAHPPASVTVPHPAPGILVSHSSALPGNPAPPAPRAYNPPRRDSNALSDPTGGLPIHPGPETLWADAPPTPNLSSAATHPSAPPPQSTSMAGVGSAVGQFRVNTGNRETGTMSTSSTARPSLSPAAVESPSPATQARGDGSNNQSLRPGAAHASAPHSRGRPETRPSRASAGQPPPPHFDTRNLSATDAAASSTARHPHRNSAPLLQVPAGVSTSPSPPASLSPSPHPASARKASPATVLPAATPPPVAISTPPSSTPPVSGQRPISMALGAHFAAHARSSGAQQNVISDQRKSSATPPINAAATPQHAASASVDSPHAPAIQHASGAATSSRPEASGFRRRLLSHQNVLSQLASVPLVPSATSGTASLQAQLRPEQSAARSGRRTSASPDPTSSPHSANVARPSIPQQKVLPRIRHSSEAGGHASAFGPSAPSALPPQVPRKEPSVSDTTLGPAALPPSTPSTSTTTNTAPPGASINSSNPYPSMPLGPPLPNPHSHAPPTNPEASSGLSRSHVVSDDASQHESNYTQSIAPAYDQAWILEDVSTYGGDEDEREAETADDSLPPSYFDVTGIPDED